MHLVRCRMDSQWRAVKYAADTVPAVLRDSDAGVAAASTRERLEIASRTKILRVLRVLRGK